jgi:hypothetical protein
VRGRFLTQGVGNLMQNTVQMGHDFIIPEAQDLIVVRAQPLVTRFIARVIGVLPTVDFYDEALFPAYEVHNISTNRMLTNKFVTGDGTRP